MTIDGHDANEYDILLTRLLLCRAIEQGRWREGADLVKRLRQSRPWAGPDNPQARADVERRQRKHLEALLARMEQQGLIEQVITEDGQRRYRVTQFGRDVATVAGHYSLPSRN